MRVYKFLSYKYGLKALQERRLKISELRYLNDPFELLPFDLSEPHLRKGVTESREQLGHNRGLICFSQHWSNPVLWAHYADSQRGLCLGFDVRDDIPQAVTYVPYPLKITHLDVDVANQFLFTKYSAWSYEDEIRMWATLHEKSGDYYFYNFNDKLALAEIIVGAGCSVTNRKLLQTLGKHHAGVHMFKVRTAYDAFLMVEDENGFA